MKRLRVIIQKDSVSKYQHKDDANLENIYVSPHCIIQGDSAVFQIKKEGRICALLLGRVLGIRGSGWSMHPLNERTNDFKEFVCSHSVDQIIPKIEGRFILIKFDDNGKLEIGCDRYSQIDFYYQRLENGIIFATDLDLLPFKNDKIKYDQSAIAHSLYIYGFRPPKKQTIYQEVKRLGVGEVAVCHEGQVNFGQLPPRIFPTKKYDIEDLKDYSGIFLDAINLRSSSAGNIVYLSSGWDSTSILASLVKLHGAKKVRAIIGRMNFSEKGVFNPYEIERAQAVSDYYGVKLEIVDLDYYRRGPEITEKLKPFMRGQMLMSMALYLHSELASYVAQTFNGEAVFCGEASDGAHNFGFAQMMTVLDHPVLEFREYSDKMATYLFGPTFLRSIWEGTFRDDSVFNFLKQRYGNVIFDDPAHDRVGQTQQLLASLFIRDKRFPFMSLKNSKLFTEKGRFMYADEMSRNYLLEAAQNITLETLYSWYIFLYNSFHWNGGTVATLDATADEFGFNMNLPYRDSRIQDFLAAMPESFGRGLEMKPTKYPQKWMLEHCVDYPFHLQVGPHSYLYDRDPDFNPSAELHFRSSFTPEYKKNMGQRKYREFCCPDNFDLGYFDQIVDHYLDGKEVLAERNDLSNLIYFSGMGSF